MPKKKAAGAAGMDIRSFFGSKKTKPKTATKKTQVGDEPRDQSSKKAQSKVVSKKSSNLTIEDDDNEADINSTDAKVNAKAKAPPSSNSNGSSNNDSKPNAKTAAEHKKPKGAASERKEVNASDFFSSKKKDENATASSAILSEKSAAATTPAKASPQKEKKKRQLPKDYFADSDSEDDNDNNDDDADSDYGEEPKEEEEEEVITKKKSPSKKQRTSPRHSAPSKPSNDSNSHQTPQQQSETVTKKRPAAAATASTASGSSSKKPKTPSSHPKKKASPKPPKRDPPLAPTLRLDSVSKLDDDELEPQCLAGYTFCLTGVMPELSRDEATERIKVLGGRVTTAVSGKTDYLVLGTVLEDGRAVHEGSKYQKATANGTLLVDGAAALCGLFRQYSDKKKKEQPSAAATTTSNLKPAPAAAAAKPAPVGSNPYATASRPAAAAAVVNPYAAVNPYTKNKSTNGGGGGSSINPYAKKTKSAPAGDDDDRKPAAVATSKTNTVNQLWVDRYKPTHSREILGNQEAVRKLGAWLQSWEHRFNHDNCVGKAFSAPNGPWKAALLSGPPGIGKTTTATLVAQECGRDVLEFNASDVRSKKAMKEAFGDITGSYTLQFRTKNAAGKNEKRKKRCIIMDEVDGMGAGDRSGMSELIQLIKHSRVPIICICNDRQSQKMKSLLPYCMDLRYRRPVKTMIAKRAIEVARLEGLSVEQNAAEAIVESCGNDVRQVLNALQMWASNNKGTSTMTYKGLKEREHSINKDEILRVSLFDAAKTIVEGRRGLMGAGKEAERSSFFKRNDAYFVDYNFVGLLVQQNYLKIMQPQFNEAKRKNDSDKTLDVLDRMHEAAHSMSDFAHAENGLRNGQNWSLLPTTAMLAVKTGYHAGGETGGMLPGFPEFTTWLGRNSTRGKKVRLLGELGHHMNYRVSGGTSEVRLSYLPVLRKQFMTLLSNDEENGGSVEDAIELMDDYGLDRDDIFEKLDEFKMDPKADDFQKIDSKKKAAFTRTYNQGTHKSQALVAEQGAAKKPKRQASGVSETKDPDAIDDDHNKSDDDEEPEEEFDADKVKALFAKKKSRKGTGKTAGKAKTAAKPKAKRTKKK